MHTPTLSQTEDSVENAHQTGTIASMEKHTMTRRQMLATALGVGLAATTIDFDERLLASEPTIPSAGPRLAENAEQLAEEAIGEYLRKNRERAHLLEEMRPTIDRFREHAPIMIVIKCMDERLQGPLPKGAPETIIQFMRSEGSVIDTHIDNKDLWDIINTAEEKAATHNGMPVMVIVAAHTGCAAHQQYLIAPNPEKGIKGQPESEDATNERALGVALNEVKQIFRSTPNEKGDGSRLFIIAAKTNTKNLGMNLYPPDGDHFFSAKNIIETGNLDKTANIFDSDFLGHVIGSIEGITAHESIKGKTIGEIFGGEKPLAFLKQEITIAIETYLLELFTHDAANNVPHKRPILNKFMRTNIDASLSASGAPPVMHPHLTHMLAWNTAHAIYRNRYLAELKETNPKAYTFETEHSGLFLCYGNDGFDTLKPQDGVLVKHTMNVSNALQIAKNVQGNTYQRLAPGHVPLVHINIELDHPITTQHQYKNVCGRLKTKLNNIDKEYGANVRMVTTYSYHSKTEGVPMTKLFFPLNPRPEDPRIICRTDVGMNFHAKHFNAVELRASELAYATGEEPEENIAAKQK